MAALCERYDVAVISDEIHMDMVWGKHRHTRGMRLRTVNGRC